MCHSHEEYDWRDEERAAEREWWEGEGEDAEEVEEEC